MFMTGDRAIVMMQDTELRSKVEPYLQARYNLETENANGILDVLQRIGTSDKSYEVIILDEDVEGLAAASHAFRTIREQQVDTSVVYLSNILEIVHPQWGGRLNKPQVFEDDDFREDMVNVRIGNILALTGPLLGAKNLGDVYMNFCMTLKEVFNADNVVCSILRMDENPVFRATVMCDLYQDNGDSIRFEGDGKISDLIQYYKPVHIPDLELDKPFQRELEVKFHHRYRSVLMIPLLIGGKCIGFFSLFTRNRKRMYRFDDIELCIRVGELASGVIIYTFAKEQGTPLKLPDFEEESQSIFPAR